MLKVKSIGGETVDRGTYLDFSIGECVYMESAWTLPGEGSRHYYKLPPVVVWALGLAYAIFFPFVGS